jgi:hypothetical protein
MKTTARMGGIISLQIIRANGTIEDLGKIHNIIGNAAAINNQRNEYGTSQGISFLSVATPVRVNLTGTWSQAGTNVTRVSGTDVTGSNSDLYEFGTGEQFYKTGGTTTAPTASRSQTVAATSLHYYLTGPADTPTSVQSATGATLTRAYSNGVLTWTLPSATTFATASSNYTLARITANLALGGGNFFHFDLPSPISLLIGDQIVISSFVLTFTYTPYQPTAFAVSPITGLTGTGFTQRLRTVVTRENTTTTRIFLITDANKITPLPDMLAPGATVLNPSSYTILETITVSNGVGFAAAITNNMTQQSVATGTVVTGGTIKQIAWGTTTELFGIVEYDTPVAIAAGKVLTLTGNLQLEAETP